MSDSPAADTLTDPRTWPTWVGIAMVVASTVALGSSPTWARIAFEHGANAEAAGFARFAVGAAVTVPILLMLPGRAAWLNRRVLVPSLGIGFLYAAQSTTYLVAIDLLPVAIAVVTFFTFPLFVALIVRVTEAVPIGGAKAVGIVLAFLGVVLVTRAAPVTIDPLGIVFALIASVGTAVYLVVGGRVSRIAGSLAFSALSFAGASLVMGGWLAVTGVATWPQTPVGWAAFGVLTLTFVGGILLFLTALMCLETVRATLLTNLEPLVAIGLAFVILGEPIGAIQGVGAALVIFAVAGPTLLDARAEQRRPAGNTHRN